MSCYLTRTTAETHTIIRDNLAETPVYGGWVDSKGPRYCPSIEDKIVRFADKDSHQVRCVPSLSPCLLAFAGLTTLASFPRLGRCEFFGNLSGACSVHMQPWDALAPCSCGIKDASRVC